MFRNSQTNAADAARNQVSAICSYARRRRSGPSCQRDQWQRIKGLLPSLLTSVGNNDVLALMMEFRHQLLDQFFFLIAVRPRHNDVYASACDVCVFARDDD